MYCVPPHCLQSLLAATLSLVVVAGCASSRPLAPATQAITTTTTSSPQLISPPAAPPATSLHSQHPFPVQQVALQQGPVAPELLNTPQPLPASERGVPMNLISALAATDAQNPQVEFARWRVREAYAQLQRANVLWLPHLRAGAAYNRHEGAIQDVAGNVFDTSRGGYYAGLGPHSVGQGSPAIPGVLLNVHTADAIFQPKVAGSAAQARSWAAQTASSDEMLESAVLYLELLRAEEEAEISREVVTKTRNLVALTGSYAKAGQGLESDHDRAKTELSLRETDQLRAQETAQVASARLATQLRLDPAEPILVQEPVAAPVQLFEPNHPVADLVAEGLSQRPELSESRWLVNEASERLRREKYAPLLPSLLLGVSYGGMSGGVGTDFGPFKDRLDADAIAYWELRNFGYGDRAARNEAGARVEQARWREVAALDRVAGEIVEAHARVRSRQQQLIVAEKGVATAQDSYRRNWLRIENAQGLPIEALQAIQALGLARRDYLRTVIDYNVAQFQLLRAIGGGSPRFLGAAEAAPRAGQ
jgi:outer membrane protein TolC